MSNEFKIKKGLVFEGDILDVNHAVTTLKNGILNYINFDSQNDEFMFFNPIYTGAGYASDMFDKTVIDNFIDRGGKKCTVDIASANTTATWKNIGSRTTVGRIGKSAGFYYPSATTKIIQTRQLTEQATQITQVIVSVLNLLSPSISEGTFDISLDAGSTWLTAQAFDTLVDVSSLAPLAGSYKMMLKLNTPTVATDTWTVKTSLNTGRNSLTGFSLNGYGYTAGGETDENTTEKYDDVADTWTAKTDLNTSRYFLASFSLNGYGYTVGGAHIGVFEYATTEKYDDVANTWTNKTVLNSATDLTAGFSLNSYGYITGGYIAATTDVTEKYDDVADTWTNKAVLNTADTKVSAFSLNGHGYKAGGTAGGDNIVEKYDAKDIQIYGYGVKWFE